MTEQEMFFCMYYLQTLNATEAAKKAGYKRAQLAVFANKLIRTARIRKFLSQTIDLEAAEKLSGTIELLEEVVATIKDTDDLDKKIDALKRLHRLEKFVKGL